MDVVAFHLVTVGRRASEYAQELFKSDNYTDYLFFHGLSVETAEALAELWHKRIREELGIAGGDAPRAHEALPSGLSGLALQLRLPGLPEPRRPDQALRAARPERIDVELTEEFQLDPEQSTSAIIVHHEEAKYFSID